MSQELMSRLTDLGSAGAVIIVVIFFLRHLKDRDAEINKVLRDFTVALNKTLDHLRK